MAILATISTTHYLLSTSSKQRNKCSRIELKMTETETQATASEGQVLLLCSWLCGCVSVRCQSHQSQQLHRSSEMQWLCHTSKSTQTEGRVTLPRHTEGWNLNVGFPPLPRCKTLTVEEGGRPYRITSLGSPRGVSHHPKRCHWHHLKTDLSSRRLSPSLRCPPVRPGCTYPSLVESHVT